MDKLIGDMERLGFVELENELDGTYKVTAAFHYIEELIESKEKRIQLSVSNKELLNKHSISTIVDLWNKVFNEVIDEKNNS